MYTSVNYPILSVYDHMSVYVSVSVSIDVSVKVDSGLVVTGQAHVVVVQSVFYFRDDGRKMRTRFDRVVLGKTDSEKVVQVERVRRGLQDGW